MGVLTLLLKDSMSMPMAMAVHMAIPRALPRITVCDPSPQATSSCGYAYINGIVWFFTVKHHVRNEAAF